MSDYICPHCAASMDLEKALWLVDGKFYCTEKCARAAKGYAG